MSIFKAYDIRGLVPQELDEDVAWRIGRAAADLGLIQVAERLEAALHASG